MSKVDGIGSLLEKLDRLGISAEEGLSKAIGKQTKKVQATAKLLCSVNQGELRNNIKTSVETEAGRVIGTVYTIRNMQPMWSSELALWESRTMREYPRR